MELGRGKEGVGLGLGGGYDQNIIHEILKEL